MPTLTISAQQVISGTVNDIRRWVATIDDTEPTISAKAKTKEEAIGLLVIQNQSMLALSVVERQTRFDRKVKKRCPA